MHRRWAMLCFLIFSVAAINAQRSERSGDQSVRLKTVRTERVDADHFRAILELVNGSSAEIYVQTSSSFSTDPYPLFIERRIKNGNWQVVAPCVDTAPAGLVGVAAAASVKMDQVYSLKATFYL